LTLNDATCKQSNPQIKKQRKTACTKKALVTSTGYHKSYQVFRPKNGYMKNHEKNLVTGGAGFIGSNLVPRFIEKGHCVIVLDNLRSEKIGNLSIVRNNPNFHFIQGDIQNKAALHEALCGIDAVVHLAALIDISASIVDLLKTHEINATGTRAVFLSANVYL
jgi:FlaA1/EpsC-like NDP-sugar epimerase